MNHVMLDIETLGTKPCSAIIELGAVYFNPFSGDMGSEFMEKITFESALDYGETEGSTIQWWLAQDKDAQQALIKGERHLASSVAKLFCEWLKKDTFIWGKGPTFDCTIIRYFINSFKLEEPWSFWNERCVRTVMDLANLKSNSIQFIGTPHCSIDDAKHQIRLVTKAYNILNIKK